MYILVLEGKRAEAEKRAAAKRVGRLLTFFVCQSLQQKLKSFFFFWRSAGPGPSAFYPSLITLHIVHIRTSSENNKNVELPNQACSLIKERHIFDRLCVTEWEHCFWYYLFGSYNKTFASAEQVASGASPRGLFVWQLLLERVEESHRHHHHQIVDQDLLPSHRLPKRHQR